MMLPQLPRPIGLLILLLAFASQTEAAVQSGEDVPAQPDAPALTLQLLGPPSVGRYERIEFQLHVDGQWANPYDPSQVDLSVELKSPSGQTLVAPAFYYQPFEWRAPAQAGGRTEWMYPTGQAEWRVRFTPAEIGNYSAVAVLKAGVHAARSAPVDFACVASTNRGYVRVARSDPRFFELTDGTPFFVLGQNVAFIGESQYLNTARAGEVFRKMAAHGANFARVWACSEDWAMAIEARKSAWGRSWNWNPPLARPPGGDGYHADDWCVRFGGTNAESLSVSPSHPVPLRPGTAYRLSGRCLTDAEASLTIELARSAVGESIRSAKRNQWTNFVRSFTTAANQWWLGDVSLRSSGKGRIWLQSLSLREAEDGPDLLWEADPNRPARGVYNQLDAFMLDRVIEAAERHGIYVQICLFTRDHYRHALSDPANPDYPLAIHDAQKLLRYAVARWGYSPHVFAWEYFNEMDPGAPTERFHRELGRYLEMVDLYAHLRTTSGWGPAPKHWHHPQLDIADLHWYLRPAWNKLWQDEVGAVLDRVKLLRDQATNKPAVLGEFGLANDAWGKSDYMEKDRQGVHVHNSLWASAFSGLSGAAQFWWWDTLDKMDTYPHYRPLAEFVRGIPFTQGRLQAVQLKTGRQNRVLAWQGRDRMYAWIHDPQATWWNEVAENKAPAEITGDSLALDSLENGAYRIEWWDTRAGKITAERTASATDQKLKIDLPAFTRDLAVKILRRP